MLFFCIQSCKSWVKCKQNPTFIVLIRMPELSVLKHFFHCTERYCVFQCLGNLYCHPFRMQWEIDNNNISSTYFRYKFRTVVPMNYSFDPHPIFHRSYNQFYIFTSLFGKYFYRVNQGKFIFPHIFKHHSQITQIFLIVRQFPEGWRSCGRTFSIFPEETIEIIATVFHRVLRYSFLQPIQGFLKG